MIAELTPSQKYIILHLEPEYARTKEQKDLKAISQAKAAQEANKEVFGRLGLARQEVSNETQLKFANSEIDSANQALQMLSSLLGDTAMMDNASLRKVFDPENNQEVRKAIGNELLRQLKENELILC